MRLVPPGTNGIALGTCISEISASGFTARHVSSTRTGTRNVVARAFGEQYQMRFVAPANAWLLRALDACIHHPP